jgi:membrane fusion protein (multidrug efflux system)
MKYFPWIMITLLTVTAMLIISSCGQSDAQTGSAKEPVETLEAVAVKVEEVQLSPFADIIQTTGIVKGRADVMLSPEEGGVVKTWLVEKGAPVREGQILGVLNDDVLDAGYRAAQAQYKIADLNYEKQREVYRQKGISELQFRSLQYARDAAKAQADLAKARLERTRLRSPIDGVFNDRFADEGEFAPPGVPIAHVVDVGSLKIFAEITERFAGNLRVGSLATIVPDAFPGDTLVGRIQYVGAAVSASNRTIPVEVYIENHNMKLKPEMIARVSILRSDRTNAILVDERVVQLVDRETLVVFVENNGIAYQRRVRVGARQGSLVEVIDGLKPGDKLIVTGYQRLVDGQPVTISG